MDMLTWLLLIVVVLVVLYVWFVRTMSAKHDTFQKMDIPTPQPVSKLFGHFGLAIKHGVFDVQTIFYDKFKDHKAYGWYDTRTPVLVVKDLDMLKDIFVKQFNCFTDRRHNVDFEPPLKDIMINIHGEHWKHVRSVVSPTFNSSRLRRMSRHVERNAQLLVENLREKQERGEPVELRDICYCFTLDVIASTGFGLDINTLKEPENVFASHCKKMIASPTRVLIFLLGLIFPTLAKILTKIGVGVFPKESKMYMAKMIEAAMENRKMSDQAGKVNDFLDLVINADKEEGGAENGLTKSEIISQAMIFLLAGYETVGNSLSFTLFLLAVHPELCKKVQDEIEKKIGKDSPSYDNVQDLQYLDQCINESIRLFPPGFIVDRQCTEAVDIQGIHIPKDMVIVVPIYAIHHDPDIWPEPEKFDPDRFLPENKSSRHPYAHLPFGQGPRNCIGMRLALLELKVAIASILQVLTPVRCDKTVYPITLGKVMLQAKDGLWVKLEPRK